MNKFTRFEHQYILVLAVRAKQDLIGELKEEQEKMKLYNNSESFIDPNIKSYIETLETIIKKSKENMEKIDREDYQNS